MSVFRQPGCFYGEPVKSCAVRGFLLSESTYRAGDRIGHHSHCFPYLSILLRGSYRETYGRRTRDCGPSTVVFHPAGEVHADHFLASGGHIFRFEIPRFPKGIACSARAALEEPFELIGGTVAWLATRLYAEFKRPDQYSPLIIEGLVLEILGYSTRRILERHNNQLPPWLLRVQELLRESAVDKLTLSRIARVADVHVVHLARVFRKFHGCTVGEYVRRLRIEYATRELRSLDKSLAQIAIEAGFSDQSHFCRAFKLSTGMSPGHYRDLFERG